MENNFCTESLNLVAWLIMHEQPIANTFFSNGVTLFCFNRTPEIEKLIKEYDNNLELKKFIVAFRKVKEIVKNNKLKNK